MTELPDEILLKYLQGECSPEDFADVKKWLEADNAHGRELFGFELDFHKGKFFNSFRPQDLDRAQQRLLGNIEKRESRKALAARRRRIRRALIGWSSAAAILIGVASSLWISNPDIFETYVTVTVPEGKDVHEFSLPDGTRVWLNQSSVVRYPETFSDSKRSIHLEGEAYFEVVRNGESPFTVDNDAMKVIVLGTSFNMNYRKGDAVAEATLLEGEIEIRGHGGNGQIVMTPGQRAELDMAAGRMTVKNVNAKLDAVWRNNLIPFENVTLDEIALVLEQLYGIPIEVASTVRNTNKYSGVLRRKDRVDDVLTSLRNTIPISYRYAGTKIVIEPSKK